MTRYIFGIFAHPDDSGFGPSGTLTLASRDGTEVHLICATCGGAGVNVNGHASLADVREREEQAACDIMGVKSLELLRYDDGQLSNDKYLEIADKVIAHIRRTVSGDDTEITLITFDPNGISGHTDHIVMSNITTYAYLKLRGEYNMQLKYFCIHEAFSPTANTDWIYMPKGRSAKEIDEIIDVRAVKDQKIAAIHAHATQSKDAESHLARGDALFDEHFMIYKD